MSTKPGPNKEPIAVIGMGLRFPGANNPQEFWHLLRQGRDMVREVPADRWDLDRLYDADVNKPGKISTRWGSFLDQIDQFDWKAFRISPREAKYLDPQQRLLLEIVWEAFEDAGIPFEELAGSNTSVTIGQVWNDYLRMQTKNWSKLDSYSGIGGMPSFASNRISYVFDLQGPSVTLDAACTSSMASIYYACQSLWSGEASLAIAGGVELMISPESSIMMSKAGLLSPTGHSRTFDAEADGFVRGEGAGVVILKPFSQVQPSERVYALLTGIALNHNGHNEWIMASNPAAQEAVIKHAHQQAGIDPNQIDYIELHSAGQPKGDPIEAQVLGKLWGEGRPEDQPCRVGSLKTNLGHLGAASGVAGLIKVALSLHHRELFPMLNLNKIHAGIDLEANSLTAQTTLEKWPAKEGAPLAAITSTGLSGSNAHAVLQAMPHYDQPYFECKNNSYLLPISAHTPEALLQATRNYAQLLTTAPDTNIHNLCSSASIKRSHRLYRSVFQGQTIAELTSQLATGATSSQGQITMNTHTPLRVAFAADTAAIANWVTCCKHLLAEPAFFALISACDHILDESLNWSLLAYLDDAHQEQPISEATISQIGNLVLVLGLAELWIQWGIGPEALICDDRLLAQAISQLAERRSLKPVFIQLLQQLPELQVKNWRASDAEVPLLPTFSRADVEALRASGCTLILELGTADQQTPAQLQEIPWLTSLQSSELKNYRAELLATLGYCYQHGAEVNWRQVYSAPFHMVNLPTYAWQRKRAWLNWLSVDEISTAPEEKYRAAVVEATGQVTVTPEPATLRQQIADLPANARTTFLLSHFSSTIMQLLELESSPQLQLQDTIFALGLDSVTITQLLNHLQQQLGCSLPFTLLFNNQTLGTVIAELLSIIAKPASARSLQISAPTSLTVLPEASALSFAQQRLWFLEQLTPGSNVYNEHCALRIRGPLQVAALAKSINELRSRHEMLSVRFGQRDGAPVQQWQPEAGVALEHVSVASLAESEREAAALKLAQHMLCQPFDLEQGPLARFGLFELNDQDFMLLIVFHHIAADGWSLGVMYQELEELYAAFAAGKASPLGALPIRYTDFVSWQSAWLKDDVLANQQEYWNQQLAGAPSALELPTDYPRPAVLRNEGQHHFFTISPELTGRIRALSKQSGVTLFMTLLMNLQLLLARYSGQDDILIGTSLANRSLPELENVVGLFLNNVVLRGRLQGNPTVTELLTRTRQTVLEAFAHKEMPFEQLLQSLHIQRDLSRSPLFQVLFVLQDKAWFDLNLAGLEVEPFELESKIAKFDLYLSLVDRESELYGSLEYNTQLFKPETIARMVEHFIELLEAITTQPEQPVHALSLLTKQEQQTMLIDWNQTQQAFPLEQTIPDLIARQAARYPDALALIDQHKELTYTQLQARAQWLAGLLQGTDIGPGCLVGLYLPRSVDMVVGILATWMVGGAYIPLDTFMPRERLATILDEAQPALILTTRELQDKLPPTSARLLCLDTNWLALALAQPAFEPIEHDPQQLAYVIYTSGSTGRPKGVMIHQQGMLNHLYIKQQDLQLKQSDRIAQTASHCFDISIWQFFAGLISGSQVHILPDEIAHDQSRLLQTVQDKQLSILEVVPSLLRAMLETSSEAELRATTRSLRWMLVTGEALPTELCQRWWQTNPAVPLLNAYGPTECSDDVTHFAITARPETTLKIMPIGQALANTRLYVLDTYLQPVPVGVAGQLFIGGTGVGHGYLGNPQRTALTFIPDNLSGESGQRLYATGDLVRLLPDGVIDFIGRIDHQVKVRGYRIELEEIEAVLQQHPAIRENVTLVYEDVPGNQQLVAYVVAASDEMPVKEELQNFLRTKLPAYMVPTLFVTLPALPLSSNGKIDRRALPAPITEQVQLQEDQLPETEMEQALAAIWQKLLGRKAPGRHENFFEIGGHSLLATQLITRIRQQLQVEVPLRDIFQAPTLAGLASLVESYEQVEKGYRLPDITPATRDILLPLSYSQQRLWFLDQLAHDSSTYNLSTALRLHGKVNISGLEHSLKEIVLRQESLRTVFRSIEGRPIQIILPQIALQLEPVDLTQVAPELQAQAFEQFAQEQVQKPFDLVHGPLIRAHLVQLNTDSYIFLLTIHHIISDGWSLGVFLRELGTLYNAYVADQQANLPELPIQYADFAVWQRKWMDNTVLESQLQYWKKQLATVPTQLNLPTDHPRPAEQTFKGSQLDVVLPLQLLQQLQELSQREGVTLYMTLLAAWKVLLYRYSNQEQIAVGTGIANRDRGETENLIGFFVNTLVMYSDLSGNPSFRHFLHNVQRICLDAYANQHVPFEQVVDAVQPERSLGVTPLFQVMFVLQNAPLSTSALQNIELELLPVNTGISKFDLTLFLTETARGLAASLEYNSAIFEPATIARMVEHYQTLLESIVQDIEQPLMALSLLTAKAEQQLLVDWNATRSDYPRQASVPTLFAEQAARTPEAVALRYARQEMSYQQLNARANQLAHYLQDRGVGRETLVGLSMERSFEMLVSILGILKAGGAYVPLDPSYPQDRLAYMLEDTQISLILTQRKFGEQLPTGEQHTLIYVAEDPQIAHYSTENPQVEIDAEQLAYIMYTSGSTGRPKGVSVMHRAIVRLVRNSNFASFTAADTFLHLAPSSFDASTLELWGSLLNGGRLVLFPVQTPSLAELAEVLQDEQISVLWLTAGLFHQMVEHQLPALAGVRYLLAGGDVLSVPQVQKVLQQPGHGTLINGYGPTENTTFTCCYPMNSVEQVGATVPIGYPIGNTKVHLLDTFMRPVPMGIPGELYTGGDGLARGYHQRPELTAERFVPDPFSAEPGGRLYKTGDLAVYRPDGSIEFIGRSDNQVKIRGFRIELGEIETALLQHPEITDGTVIAHSDENGTKRLLAYVVARDSHQRPTGPELRSYLRSSLPDYMVPASITLMDELPLTSNGKIDRRALPAPDYSQQTAASAKTVQEPRSDIEQQLLTIWRQVLNYPDIGVDDNFFGCGGDSILSIQIVAKANQQGLPLQAQHFFQHPTIAEMAAVLLEQQAPQATNRTTEIEQQLLTIWRQVLNFPDIGVNDNFFGSGGDSILSIQIVAKANQEGLALHPQHFFQYPTVAEMAAVLVEQQVPQTVNRVAEIKQQLLDIWRQVLNFPDIGVNDNFFGCGGDSILSIQIVAKANQQGLALHPQHFFQHQSVAEMATMLAEQDTQQLAVAAEQEQVEGEVPLTAIQHWFFELDLPERQHWNQATLLEMRQHIQPEIVQQALDHLLRQHDALRMRYAQVDGQWQQHNSRHEGLQAVPFKVFNLATCSHEEQLQAIYTHTDEAERSLDLQQGPLLQVVYFDLGAAEPVRLFIAIHHLVVDGISWRVLLEDLQNLCIQLHNQQTPQLPPRTVSFRQWAQQVSDYTARPDFQQQELAYWREQSQHFQVELPMDHVDGANVFSSESTVLVKLTKKETHKLLHEVQNVYHTQINDILLTALALTLNLWNNREEITISLEGHGRDDMFGLDSSRTVGWFTSFYPVHFNLKDCQSLSCAIKSIKEQLRSVPNHGIGYSMLRYLADDSVKHELASWAKPALSFNYMGQFDQIFSEEQLFMPAAEAFGPGYSELGKRPHLLEVASRIHSGQLQFEWNYSRNCHDEETIKEIAAEFIYALQEILAHCQEADAGGFTPSDFPLANLTQQQLDQQVSMHRQVEDIYPLTPLQHGLLFHSLYEPGTGDYIIQVGMTFDQGFNEPAFRKAWDYVIQRYTILRTSFIWEGLSEAQQVVYKDIFIPTIQQDWRHMSAEQQQEQLEIYQQEDRLQEFQIAQAPLMRLFIARLSEEKYAVLWSYHHLLLDGWSLPLVMEYLFESYTALAQQREPQLRSQTPYREYIRWLQLQDKPKAERFWRRVLKGFTTPTPLGIDLKPQEEQEPGYDEQSVYLPADQTQALTMLARQQQVTVNTLMQAAWSLLLHHYSGEDDIIFGAVTSGRTATLKEIENMVGLFINTVPVRVQILPDISVNDWFHQLHKQQTESNQYAYSPLSQIQGWSEIERGTQLFESLLVFENYPLDEAAVSGQDANLARTIQSIQVIEQTSYPITLAITPGKRLKIKAMYNRERITATALEDMLKQFQQILRSFIEQPDEIVSQVRVWSEQDYRQIQASITRTAQSFPVEQTLHGIFESQVARNPLAIAAVCEHATLNYGELNKRANQVARYLRQIGVGPEVHVGLCVERSLELLIGVLAILKAGGTYVPLDPTYPPERLAYILEDAEISVLLTQQHLKDNLPTISEYVIGLDAIEPLLSLEPGENLVNLVQPENGAYIIYTSGSTGNPKGVVVSHGNVVRLFSATEQQYHFDQHDVWTLFHSYAFDFSVWEIWGPLLYGGKLVVIPFWISRSPELFYQLLHTHKVTVLNQTPSAFNQLIQIEHTVENRRPLALRLVIFGGEALELQSLRPWFEVHGDQQPQLVNMYGITETTVHVTYRHIQAADLLEGMGSMIGVPISDLHVLIMDQYGRPLPTGVAGEMYVGGAGLARGYLNRPELTAERFVPHPFSDEPGARLYRSGDLARRLPNGDLEYLGRIDHQVKIRGFRIELGEIEAAIGGHSAVHENVVLARESRAGSKQLVGYVVLRPASSLTQEQLQTYLQEKLPHYMVPTTVVFLAELPLNHNGKVNRRALPEPESLYQDDAKRYVAPQNEVQETLAKIWAAVLRVERVGIRDNFFALGGDSILSIQIIGRASQLGLRLTPKLIFQYQTIEQLCAVVEYAPTIQAQQSAVTGEVALTPIQHWFFEQQQPQPQHWNQSMLVSVLQPINASYLRSALDSLLEHHDALRLRFTQAEGGWRQENEDSGEAVAFHYINLAQTSTENQRRKMLAFEAELQGSLKLAQGPLMQVAYFQLDNPAMPDQLLLVIHHLVVDGFSWRVLLEDLQTAYRQYSQGQALELPKKTTSFQAWASHLVNYAQSEQVRQEAAYWTQEIQTSQPGIPMDYPEQRQHNSIGSAEHIELTLPEAETQVLLEVLPELYNTQMNDVLLTALAQVLTHWSQSEAVLIELEGHGREDLFADVDLSRTIGWFTSIFPVQLRSAAGMSLLEQLKHNKEHLRSIPNHGVGYGILRYLSQDQELVQALKPVEQPQVVFNYLGQFETPVTAEDALFAGLTPSAGPTQHESGSRNHLLAINSLVQARKLVISWEFNPAIHKRTTIQTLASAYIQALQDLAALAQAPQTDLIYTPSDFPDLAVDQDELDFLLSEIDLGE